MSFECIILVYSLWGTLRISNTSYSVTLALFPKFVHSI